MIEVTNLQLNYGSAAILNNLSFKIAKGSMLGLIGPNGAGKSSLIKVLAGLVYPQSGTLKFKDAPISFADLRRHTGYMIDGPSFYKQLSGPQNLSLIKQVNHAEIDLDDLLVRVGLEGVGSKKVRHYSTGMKQRLAIAAALIGTPELLILDEPFNGLDPGGYQDLWDILKDLNQQGTTLVISSHLLADLEAHATDFMLINNGAITMNLSKAALDTTERLISFYFEAALKDEELAVFNGYSIQEQEGDHIQLLMNPKDIAVFTKSLVDQGLVPVNIKTQTILQQTYFKMSR